MALDEVPDVLTNLLTILVSGWGSGSGLELAKGLEPPTL